MLLVSLCALHAQVNAFVLTREMFRVSFRFFNFNKSKGVIGVECIRVVVHRWNYYERLIQAAHISHRPPPPPDGRRVRTHNDFIQYLNNPAIENVVVLAGAGISTLSGIPDFRTPGTGLFSNLSRFNLPYPEAIFEMDFFLRDPRPFFTLAKELYPGGYRPGIPHAFMKLLEEKGKLLRVYTQNIDGLEKLAGISGEKLVEAHGSFETATCLICNTSYRGEEIRDEIFGNRIPICKAQNCNGIVKPDIVFFGENLPDKFQLCYQDMNQADLMIIMGTSLRVFPFATLASSVADHVPIVLLNRMHVSLMDRQNDVHVLGGLGQIIPDVVQRLGWEREFWEIQNRFSE